MAKCLSCDCVFGVFGGSNGSKCPTCESERIDTSKETPYSYDSLIESRKRLREEEIE